MNKTYLILLLILMASGAALTSSCSRTSGFEAIDKTGDGMALRGFDAVAYFTIEKAVEGSPKHEFFWNGAKWLFSNAENLEKFKQNPESFAPQFGGYCSYAVSQGYTADGDPNEWKVVDGKLYLNYNHEAKEAWDKEQDKLIEQGKKNWAGFQKQKPKHKG
jgi:YHS domain-containing protein